MFLQNISLKYTQPFLGLREISVIHIKTNVCIAIIELWEKSQNEMQFHLVQTIANVAAKNCQEKRNQRKQKIHKRNFIIKILIVKNLGHEKHYQCTATNHMNKQNFIFKILDIKNFNQSKFYQCFPFPFHKVKIISSFLSFQLQQTNPK